MTDPGPPPKWLWAAEFPRGLWGAAALLGARRVLRDAPRGDGRPVLLLPGLFNSDASMLVMRRYLRTLGYRTAKWELGRNLGSRAIGPEGERLLARIAALYAEAGEPMTLIGVSLGGLMARFAAHRAPEMVREVITISAPFAGPPTATNVWRAFEWLSGERIADPKVHAQAAEIAQPLPVPTTAIWSRSDGLVNGTICHDAACDAIEVRSSHVLVQLRPEVLRAVAEALARNRA